mmetsp:Transcript_20555/g.36100  ORF Transcript_20555/g.36100 Transcript_20555/m.36100 type:complete len:337 (-) Transcript_20555:1914-2924(-)
MTAFLRRCVAHNHLLGRLPSTGSGTTFYAARCLMLSENNAFINSTMIGVRQWRKLSSSSSSSSTQHVLMETLSSNNVVAKNEAADHTFITKLTLSRAKANAMGKQMMKDMADCLDELEDPNNNTRCLVLTSFSQKVFSAGADLKERATMTLDEAELFVTLLRNTMERVASLPFPVIAAVEGVAVGGGLELALAADIRIAGEAAVFGLPETSLAIVPGAGGTQRLPRLIGISRAKELIWTGRKINGDEALKLGLVDEVVPTGEATTQAVKLGFKIAENGPIAIRASKQAIDCGLQLTNMKEALEIERQCYAKVLPTKDRLEGLAAFKEGRKPKYTGQ